MPEHEKKIGRKKLEAPNSFLLVYPNSFYLGMSNLGYQSVLSIVDEQPEWYAERAFAGLERSLEQKRTFSSFDVIAFSIAYEMDYITLPAIFRSGRIPLRSDQREDHHPLIMAGGIALMINPEPIADFVDLIVFGEAEEVLPAILKQLISGRSITRTEILEKLAALRGVYVPRFYKNRFDRQGRLVETIGEQEVPFPVKRTWVADLDRHQTASLYINPHTVFPNRVLLEIGRGCRRRCRFCATTCLYQPVRNRSAQAIYRLADKFHGRTRFLGLISPAGSDHPEIDVIVSQLVDKGFSISISSLRADSITPRLLEALAASGQRMITLAPEAGSISLRKRINKDIPDEAIAAALRSARQAGIIRGKLYFLIGLPGETANDIEMIVKLTYRLSSLLPLSISLSPFIPKPHTPFQWCGLEQFDSLKGKMRYLESALKKNRRVKVSAASVRAAVRQACLSRGDRRMGKVIESGDWATAEAVSSPYRFRRRSEFLPWSIFESRGEAADLWEEYRNCNLG